MKGGTESLTSDEVSSKLIELQMKLRTEKKETEAKALMNAVMADNDKALRDALALLIIHNNKEIRDLASNLLNAWKPNLEGGPKLSAVKPPEPVLMNPVPTSSKPSTTPKQSPQPIDVKPQPTDVKPPPIDVKPLPRSVEERINIKELYDKAKNSPLTKKRSTFHSFMRATFKKNASSKESQARIKQIGALQELADKQHEPGNRALQKLELYCSLKYMLDNFQKENKKLPSALEKVCNDLITKIENDPVKFNEIKEKYYDIANPSGNRPMDMEHMKMIALDALARTKAYEQPAEKPGAKPSKPSS